MEFILIPAVIVLAILYSTEKRKNSDAPANRMITGNGYQNAGRLQMSPDVIRREADNLRRASESALRARAEGLVERYSQSALLSDLEDTIRDCIKYGIIWDIELGDGDIAITTMTDQIENRICLMTERLDYTEMGYQDPPRESEHRLALALALQKKLGADYGVEYQFQYDPVNDNFILSRLSVAYRKKEQEDHSVELKSPI